MQNILKVSSLALLFFIGSSIRAFATSTPNCQQIYNGGPSCVQDSVLHLNKEVKHPTTNTYADSFGTSALFTPGQSVQFKLTITNTSDAAIKNITLADIFPSQIAFTTGQGKFDPKTRTLTLTIDELKAKESKVYFIVGKVAAKDAMTSQQATFCIINQATVTASGKNSQDNTSMCINKDGITDPATQQTKTTTTKGGLPILSPSTTKTTPGTGPETWALMGLIPLGGLGFLLRSKARA